VNPRSGEAPGATSSRGSSCVNDESNYHLHVYFYAMGGPRAVMDLLAAGSEAEIRGTLAELVE
jgi:hypothetical protein